MHVVLSLQKCSKWNKHDDKPGPGLGACSNYSEDQWSSDLQKLAALSNESSNVLGIDLFNEPYGFTWEKWRQMATRGGEAVLRVNPRTLIFVEGIANESTAGNYYAFWGENLFEAGSRHVEIPMARLVFSPHVYGPSVGMQDYFKSPKFPINMSEVWYQHFGYMAPYWPIVIGEFGGRYEGMDKIWGDELVRYLINENMGDFFYWALNPNSGDTGGLLKDDWLTVDENKLFYLRRLLLR
jgi:endoglucanase